MSSREGEANKLEKWAMQKIDPVYETARVTVGVMFGCVSGMLIYDGENFGYVLAAGSAVLTYKGIINLIRYSQLQEAYSEGFSQQN